MTASSFQFSALWLEFGRLTQEGRKCDNALEPTLGQSPFLTCPVCPCPCCLVCSGLCLGGLCRCWKKSMVFSWTLLLWSSCGTLNCVSPYCSHGIELRADACLSCSCPCCSRPGESCPSAFRYLRMKTTNGSVQWQVAHLILFVKCRETDCTCMFIAVGVNISSVLLHCLKKQNHSHHGFLMSVQVVIL